MTRDEQRDDRLGAALRELRVPEHAPGFASALRARLDEEPAPASAPDAARPRGRRLRIPRLALGGVLATALAVLVAAFLLLTPNDGGRAPGGLGAAPATAAELGARVGDALARIETLQAVLVVTERPSPDLPLKTTRYRLLRDSAGDERAWRRSAAASTAPSTPAQASRARRPTPPTATRRP